MSREIDSASTKPSTDTAPETAPAAGQEVRPPRTLPLSKAKKLIAGAINERS